MNRQMVGGRLVQFDPRVEQLGSWLKTKQWTLIGTSTHRYKLTGSDSIREERSEVMLKDAFSEISELLSERVVYAASQEQRNYPGLSFDETLHFHWLAWCAR